MSPAPQPPAPAPAWQPIESAPRDRLILLCRDDAELYEPSLGWWAEAVVSDSNEWDNGMDAGWFSQGGFYPSGDARDQPTHWMPLPEPPSLVVSSPEKENADGLRVVPSEVNREA